MAGSGNNQGPQNPLAAELQALQQQQRQPFGTTETPVLSQLADAGNFLVNALGDIQQGQIDYKNPAAAEKRQLNKDIANQFVQLPEAEALKGTQRQLFLKFAQAGDVDEMQQVLAGAKSGQKAKDLAEQVRLGRRYMEDVKDQFTPNEFAFYSKLLETSPDAAISKLITLGKGKRSEAIQGLEKQAQDIQKQADEAKPQASFVLDFDKGTQKLQSAPPEAFSDPEILHKEYGVSKPVAQYLAQSNAKLNAGRGGLFSGQPLLDTPTFLQQARTLLPQDQLTAHAVVQQAKDVQAELKRKQSDEKFLTGRMRSSGNDRLKRLANKSPQDKQALDWAQKNPNDPRAIQILQKLGAK